MDQTNDRAEEENVSKDNGQGTASPTLARTRDDGFSTEQEVALERHQAGEVASAQHFIQSRFAMAKRFPRDLNRVAADLDRACRDTEFADDAVYAVPRGKKKDEATGAWIENMIEGLSIRFAEEALNRMGNILAETVTVSEDQRTRVLRVYVTDLEANNTISSEIVVSKTVERSSLRKGQKSIAERVNSYGDVVHTVEATDADMQAKVGALASKALRDNVLRFLPSWLKRKCLETAKATSAAPANESREQTARKIAAVFAGFGVAVEDLDAYLGHPLVQFTDAERVSLKKLAAAIKDGQTSWAEAAAEKKAPDRKAPERAQGDLGSMKPGAKEAHQNHDESAAATKAATAKKDDPKTEARAREMVEEAVTEQAADLFAGSVLAPAPAPADATDEDLGLDDEPPMRRVDGPSAPTSAEVNDAVQAATIREVLAAAKALDLDPEDVLGYAKNIGLPERDDLEGYAVTELNRLLDSLVKERIKQANASRLEPKIERLTALREKVRAEVIPCPFAGDDKWLSYVRARVVPHEFVLPLSGCSEAALDAAVAVHDKLLAKKPRKGAAVK